MSQTNPLGLDGIEFVEFSSPSPKNLDAIFTEFGFSRLLEHKSYDLDLYQQGDIHLVVNRRPGSFSEHFYKEHGPCVSSMAWRVKDAKLAHQEALKRGAESAQGDHKTREGLPLAAIKGVGGSLIYFVDHYQDQDFYARLGFQPARNPQKVSDKGFLVIDHLTNNVHNGTMEQWANFYKNIFGFVEIRYFDIRGIKTGLTSFALKSPCGKFCIPINEASEKKSQINEYLEEYKGPGVQHIAFLTQDILKTLESLRGSSIETLDIDADYYDTIFTRVPHVTEDHTRIKDFNVLVDGDEEGYLLQIFTKNLIGPIFIEIIQRKNHHAFGEGNFGALFRAIEKDQERRGYLEK